MTWSAAFGLALKSLMTSERSTSRRLPSVNASTTRLSWVDNVRVLNFMTFSCTKPPKSGGFVEKNINSIAYWRASSLLIPLDKAPAH